MQLSSNASPVDPTPKRHMLSRNFVIGLLLLVIPLISQILIQIQASQQHTDTNVLSYAADQSTLSQTLTKNVLLFSTMNATEGGQARSDLAGQIKIALDTWSRVANGLRNGDSELGLPGNNSAAVNLLYEQIEPHYEAMRQGATCLINPYVGAASDPACAGSEQTYTAAVTDHADAYLLGTQQITDQLEQEAAMRVNSLRNVQVLLGVLLVVAFLAMGFFVFLPRGKEYLRLVSALRDSEVRLQRRANAMETVSRVSAAAATSLDPDQLLQNVVDLTRSSFKLYHAHIYLLDDYNEQLILAAGAGDPGRQMKANGHRIALDHPRSLVARSARTRRVSISNDVTIEPDFLPNPLLPNTKAEMSVPMIIGNTLVGVLDMQSDEIDHFSGEDARIHAALAEQIAVAVENARIHGQVQTARKSEQVALHDSERLADELKLVADVSAAASAILDIDALLPSVTELTNTTFALYHTHIYLLDERFEYLVLAAGAGEAGRIMKAQGHRIALRNQGSLVARAGRSRRAVVVNDIHQAVDWLPNPLLPDTQSEMALPMVVGNALIGVLDVQSDKLDYFNDSTVMVQTALADQIGIAIQNARLFQETRLTQTVIENNNDSVIITDIEQRAIYVNPRFSELFGFTPQEMIGRTPHLLQGPMSQRDRLDLIRTALEQQRAIQQELINYRKDGTPFWIELSISPVIDNKGRLTHFIGIQQDITDRKTLEMHRDQMLKQAEEQANLERATADRLREIDRLKSDFLASMSHELRTPLNSIIGYSEVMLDGIDGELPESAVEDVQAIYDSGQHLLSLINDVLDLAKIEAGRMELDLEPTPLEEVLEEVQRLSRILLKSKPVTLTVEVADDLPWLYVDRVRLRQILNNLVGNAIKFTERGEVRIAAEVQAESGFAHLSVRDSGIGINKEHLSAIFEQFRQIDSGSTRKAGGTGLGLPITKRLVEMQGGKIWVESVAGIGSTFHFTIPLAGSKEAVVRRQIEEL